MFKLLKVNLFFIIILFGLSTLTFSSNSNEVKSKKKGKTFKVDVSISDNLFKILANNAFKFLETEENHLEHPF